MHPFSRKVGTSTKNNPLYHEWTLLVSKSKRKTITIDLCDVWKKNFNEFLIWSLKNGYNSHKSLRRKDESKIFEPSNCFWV